VGTSSQLRTVVSKVPAVTLELLQSSSLSGGATFLNSSPKEVCSLDGCRGIADLIVAEVGAAAGESCAALVAEAAKVFKASWSKATCCESEILPRRCTAVDVRNSESIKLGRPRGLLLTL